MMMFHGKLGLAAGGAMMLAGCVSFGGKPPERLLSLSAAQKVAPGTLRSASSGTAITVADPDAHTMLDTVRVQVIKSTNSLAYVKKVQWAHTPGQLFPKLIAENHADTRTSNILAQRAPKHQSGRCRRGGRQG